MYVIIRELPLCVLLSYIKDVYSLYCVRRAQVKVGLRLERRYSQQ